MIVNGSRNITDVKAHKASMDGSKTRMTPVLDRWAAERFIHGASRSLVELAHDGVGHRWSYDDDDDDDGNDNDDSDNDDENDLD